MKLEGQAPRTERGYAMAVLLVGLGVMAILLTAAMPVWRQISQREREEELIFRGNQYARAIGLYQRKYANTSPPSLDVLLEQRFLRAKYKDPMVADGEFQLLYQSTQAAGSRGGQAARRGGRIRRGQSGRKRHRARRHHRRRQQEHADGAAGLQRGQPLQRVAVRVRHPDTAAGRVPGLGHPGVRRECGRTRGPLRRDRGRPRHRERAGARDAANGARRGTAPGWAREVRRPATVTLTVALTPRGVLGPAASGLQVFHHRVVKRRPHLLDRGVAPRRMHAVGQQDDVDAGGGIDPQRRAGEPRVAERGRAT